MAIVEVKNASGAVVWQSPALEEPLIEQVENTVKVFEFATGQIIASYELKAGEYVAREERA